MVDVAVSTQLQQWTFEKPTLVHPERSVSSTPSPDLYHSHSHSKPLRVPAAAVDDSSDPDAIEAPSFQERYLSSEEDLSPMEGNSDSESDQEVSIHQGKKEYFSARKMSVSRFDKGKSCDLAVLVSITSAGRPKMIDLASLGLPFEQPSPPPQRSSSLAQLPIAAINKLRKAQQASRLSLAVSPVSSLPSTTRSTSPAPSVQLRQASPTPTTCSRKDSALLSSDSSSSGSSTSSRSLWAPGKPTRSFTSSSVPNKTPRTNTRRPASAAAPARSSLFITSSAPIKPLSSSGARPTPRSLEPHLFLSTDPYETSTVSSASPIIKSSSPHKRLRSISQRLSLAKIAITPSTKKWDSRINGKTANSPLTPQTAPLPLAPSTNKLRRNSRLSSRPSSRVGIPEMAPTPSTLLEPQPRTRTQRLTPRGANEREPMLELPPYPAIDLGNDLMKPRRIRKRRSLMDLL